MYIYIFILNISSINDPSIIKAQNSSSQKHNRLIYKFTGQSSRYKMILIRSCLRISLFHVGIELAKCLVHSLSAFNLKLHLLT